MYHTSPNEIKKGSINNNGVAGGCLFFSDDIYTMTASDEVFIYEADFDCVSVSELHDVEIISEIAEYFEVDDEVAEALLDSTQSEWNLEHFECDGHDSWWLQGKRGEAAKKMGYDGCKDEDEQGVVYIVPMVGREDQLKLVDKT